MPPTSSHLVIDARPRGPGGPLADERLQGRSVLAHLLDLALALGEGMVVVHARRDDHRRFQDLIADRPGGRVVFATGPPSEDAVILRSDRLYDRARLRRALKRRQDPESAVLWRLDQPQGLAGAEDELTRRQFYQPLGRYWALAPARRLARWLCPTRVRPNSLTLASGALMLAAAAGVACAPAGFPTQAAVAAALALALVLDTADGHLARLQGTTSEFGRWLDAYLDELSDMALHAAIAWAAFVRTGQPGWLLLGMLYGMGKYQFVVATSAWDGQREQGVATQGVGEVTPTRNVGMRGTWRAGEIVTSCVRLAGHADVRWHLWIVLAAIGRLDVALASHAVYFPVRALGAAARKAARHG